MKRKTKSLLILLGIVVFTAITVLALSSGALASLARLFSISPLAPPPSPTVSRGLQSSPLGTPVPFPQWTATSVSVATATPTIPPPPGYPTGAPWPPQVTPEPPQATILPRAFPTPAFYSTPTGQRPVRLQRLWFPYFPDPARSPQLQVLLLDQHGQRWTLSDQVVDLGLRPEFPGPTLVDLHSSPDQQLLVADIAFGESIGSVIIDPSRGTIRQIPGEFAYFYAWHPDSRRIIVSAIEGWLLVDVVSQSYETIDFRSERGDWLPVRALAYSPDGKQLADALVYAPTVSKPIGEIEVGIWLERDSRTSLFRLTGGSMIAEHSLRWSPDGRTLILVADVHDGGRRTQLWAIDVADRSPELLGILAQEAQYNHPAVWSPDGRYIAAIVEEVNDNGIVSDNIYLFTPDSEAAQKITHFSGRRLSHLAWSPDGSMLAFSVSLGDYGEIWVTTLDGTRQYPIAGPATPDAPFVWLP